MFVENARGNPSRYAGCGEEYAKGFEQVVAYYDEQYAASVDILSQLSTEDFNKKCTTPGNAVITVWKWMRLMVEHEIHHRGQLYVYLGMLGIKTPPIYGLTSEQVIENSAG